jgi:hypothetical protein
MEANLTKVQTTNRPKETLATVFFSEPSLKRILTYLCNARPPGSWDPVTATVLDLLTGKLQFCLSATGLIPFRGHADLVYPYHMMSPEQKEFIRTALQERSGYTVCNDSVVFNTPTGDSERLDTVSVLEAMCSKVLESKVHEDHSVRVGVCNILLQRVQSVVPISRAVQQRLNGLLFGSDVKPP